MAPGAFPKAALLAALVAAAAAVAAAAHEDHEATVVCHDALSSEHLSEAVDAALMELQGTKGWFHGLRSTSGYPAALGVFSCTPDAGKWPYPNATGPAAGLLGRVVSSGELKVAGVKWSREGAADYKTDPENPTGFWPKYLEEIAAKLSAAYGKAIKVKRVYYDNSALVNAAVAEGKEVDMSEPYYYASGFFGNEPRIESMHFSCITAGLASKFFTKQGSGIASTDDLYKKIEDGPNRAVGFIGKGNYDAVSALLPDSTTPTYITNATEMELNVQSGALVAGYLSEGTTSAGSLFTVFETGVISPRVSLFRMDTPDCHDHDHDDGESTAGVVAAIVIAVVALVLVLLLAYVISRERKGSPLFAPLLAPEGATQL